MKTRRYQTLVIRRVSFVCAASLLFSSMGCTKLKENTTSIEKDVDSSTQPANPGTGGHTTQQPSGISGTSTKKDSRIDAAVPLEAAIPSSDAVDMRADSSQSEISCFEEGALSCVARDSAARQVCHDGDWMAADPCGVGEVCDDSNSDEPGRCVNNSPPCLGLTNSFICVDDTMYECDADAFSISNEQCKSRRHCLLGLDNESCAECIPNQEYLCDDRDLKFCKENGMDFEPYEVCSSTERCDAVIGACVVIEECSDSSDCSSTGECVKPVCSNGTCATRIDEGGSCESQDERVCNAFGDCVECYTDRHCTSDKPVCDPDNETCEECLVDSDCDSNEECRSNKCSYVAVCGNGILESGEDCDDGNTYEFDSCSSLCKYRMCSRNQEECSTREWCVSNEQNPPAYACALKCGWGYPPCPDFGYDRGTECVMAGTIGSCLFTCPGNTKCPASLRCYKGVMVELNGEIYGPYDNCGP